MYHEVLIDLFVEELPDDAAMLRIRIARKDNDLSTVL